MCIISDLLLYLLRQQDLRYSSHGDTPTPPLSFPHLTHLSQKRTWERFTSVLCFPSEPWPPDDVTSVAPSPPLLMLSCSRFTAFTCGLLYGFACGTSLQFQKYLFSTCISHSQISYLGHLYVSVCLHLFACLSQG